MDNNKNNIPICHDFTEYSDWKKNPNKKIGVTWSGWCSKCGFKLENKPYSRDISIEGDGRRLGRITQSIVIDGIRYIAEKDFIGCSVCYPFLKN